MKGPIRPIVVAGVILAVFFVLVSIQSSYASFRRFYAFSNLGDGFTGNICVDGFSVGFVRGTVTGTRMIDVMTYPTGTSVITQVLDTNWVTVASEAPYTMSAPSPFCEQNHWSSSVEGYTYCSGLHYVRFPNELPVGTRLTIGFYDEQGSLGRGRYGEEDYEQVSASDCHLGATWIALGRQAPDGTTRIITESTDLSVFAADPDIPPWGGQPFLSGVGINSVVMSVIDPFGTVAYSRAASSPPYCLFGETSQGSCQSWIFGDHGYTWPGGIPVVPGTHRIRAAVDSYYGNDETVEWAVDVQRTYWQEHRYLPYINANSSFPVSAQQRSR